ncbi:MAG: SLC13 family permease [Caulobacteraceae bacterium]
MTDAARFAVWTIAALAAAGVVARPFRWPEAVWAAGGAAALLAAGLIAWSAALHAVWRGREVYLFLVGMMLLAETARREGLFDWTAAAAVNAARGSPARLFALTWAVGVAVTVFLSNDATAVVLTPAVYAAAKKASAPKLPYLLVCAFVANAASFVLPISNPANLVLFGGHTPALLPWLARFAAPSAVAIVATFAILAWTQRAALGGTCAARIAPPALSPGGRDALIGIAVTGAALLIVSGLDLALGGPTFALGAATAGIVSIRKRAAPWATIRGISWSILPLVAGLFVLVEALNRTGAIGALAGALAASARTSEAWTAAVAGTAVAVADNLINNLPAGVVASTAVAAAHSPPRVEDALLIGVDLGPGLSITGSLATILWLTAIRREGEDVSFLGFLKVGAIVMPPALALAIGARLVVG